jgi:hypothetical protein
MLSIIFSVYEQTKMTQGYFYTLSAIAQAFAAIVALNAVFVIYKFQLLRNQHAESIMELRRLHRQRRRGLSVQVEMWTDQEVLNVSRKIADGEEELSKRFKEKLKAFDKIKIFSRDITEWFKITLKFNIATIILSLVLLPLGGLFPNYLKSIVLVEILFLSLLSLLVTVHTILITLESGELTLISRIFESEKKQK